VLQHAGPDSTLHILAAAPLQHDRLDARLVQQVAEHEPGGASAKNPNLGALCHVSV